MKRPNVYPIPLGNFRSFWTTDDSVVSRWCNQVGHFARPCPGNLPSPKAPLRYQNDHFNYVHPGPFQHPPPLYTPPSSHSQSTFLMPSSRSNVNRHDTMGYPYREMLPIPVPYDDHLFHPLIKPTTSTCQKI